MLKSATLQNKLKDTEIKKLKQKLKNLGVDIHSVNLNIISAKASSKLPEIG